MTKASPSIQIVPAPRQKPIMSMIVPGRRALGEQWRKVVIYPDPDTGHYLIDNEETAAPPERTPIFVPGMGEMSVEMADYILERSRHRQAEGARRRGKPSAKEIHEEVNRLWFDWMDQKTRAFKGQSVSGPGGWTQREKVQHARR